MHQKDADGMANSEDPGQTAPSPLRSSLTLVCTVYLDLSQFLKFSNHLFLFMSYVNDKENSILIKDALKNSLFFFNTHIVRKGKRTKYT